VARLVLDVNLRRLLSLSDPPLRAFYRKLKAEGLVLEYDPSPPVPGVSNKGGFTFRERTPTDGDLLIRVNEFTLLTDEGRAIWRYPPQDP
jgi:hypothetical protein